MKVSKKGFVYPYVMILIFPVILFMLAVIDFTAKGYIEMNSSIKEEQAYLIAETGINDMIKRIKDIDFTNSIDFYYFLSFEGNTIGYSRARPQYAPYVLVKVYKSGIFPDINYNITAISYYLDFRYQKNYVLKQEDL